MRRFLPLVVLLGAGIYFAAAAIAPGSDPPAIPKRAKPPKWSDNVTDIFFPDARTMLQGTRPTFATGSSGSKPPGPASGGPATPDSAPPAAGGFAWSKIVSSDVLESEIKSYPPLLAEEIKSPSVFKGGGSKNCRRYFSMLALTFGIVGEYDGDVRWKNQGFAARDLFARAGFNCKVGTDQSFSESKLRAEDLQSLVGGGTVAPPANIDPKLPWPKIVNRPPLMSRLDLAETERLLKWTAGKDDFNKNADAASHEAQIIAAIADVIQRDGFEFADDSSYKGFAAEMEKAALAIVEAAKSKNYDAARTANGNLSKACANCHSGFRS